VEDLFALIQKQGPWIYVLLFGYCALKSGALPLFAGFAAQAGALDLLPVVAATFAGGYLGDELRFAVARRYGVRGLTGWPRLKRAFDSAAIMADRYGLLYIFLYRYPKGMRTIGALPVGLGSMRWARFSALNAASAVLWTFVLVGFGYAFGAQVGRAVESGWGTASVVLLAAMVGAIVLLWRRMNRTGLTA
jgi:membrane-associated protein